jgi:CRISPR-associated protein Cmr4
MSYRQDRYLLMTVDPTHIGTGGYRLGRVDNTIIREPGTNLPKIPGTSLSGAVRSYAAYRYRKPRCAGQGQPKPNREQATGHCGRTKCPICYTFGHTRGDRSYAGTVRLFDAHLALFPVHSMTGPVWVGTPERLTDLGFDVPLPDGVQLDDEHILTTWGREEPLNLGWILLPSASQQRVNAAPPEGSDWAVQAEWTTVKDRIVLVSPGIFSQIVNSNLEVRTSVSIDPETGAAQRGALFTYEAIPRAAFLVCDVVEDDYRNSDASDWPVTRVYVAGKDGAPGEENAGDAIFASDEPQQAWTRPADVVLSGLVWTETLGVGGMGTRGFGRLRIVGAPWTMRDSRPPQEEQRETPELAEEGNDG